MQYDVVIIGAGSAGASTALSCARRGLRTLCLDARHLSRAGASWINAIPRHCFTAAGITPPFGAEHVSEGAPFYLIAGWEGPSFRIPSDGLIEVDMRQLVDRLQREAIEAGAELRGRVAVRGLTEDGVAVDGEELKARVVVDASGMKGARLLAGPETPTARTCIAAQAVHRIADPQAAAAFFTSRGHRPGDVMVFTGIAGGYSIVNITLHGDRVGILTGSIPGLGFPSGTRLLREFVAQQDWVGERLSGGAGAIPLAAPFVLARDRVALVGDAGSQVYAMHGSGVGAGLVAGSILAETLANGGTPEDYATRWMRDHGGNFARAFLFAMLSSTLSIDELTALMGSGLMTPGLLADGLAQRTPRLRPRELPALLTGVARQRHLIRKLAPLLAKMAAAEALYATTPARRGREAWEQQVSRLLNG
ncbi:MAG: NAD(P)/FAD-dependent oxidoreductase [Myxococcota bacterium]|nr:NAD(P)/FAD-dependent oxidoreductase [Myxococcota bacterium]